MGSIGLNRRRFIALASGTVCAQAAAGFAATATRSGLAFGVQLFEVRDLIAATPTEGGLAAVLRHIARIGYASVETFPAVYKYPAKTLHQLIREQGLVVPSGHFDLSAIEKQMEYAAALGVEWVVCPWTPDQYHGSVEGFRRAAHFFSQAAARARASGLKFAYHPHNYAFRPLPASKGASESAFSIYMRECSPDVHVELDVYWVVAGGGDPLALINQYPERIRLIHMKDRRRGAVVSDNPGADGNQFVGMGQGSIDWKSILSLAKRQGIRQYFMDQDVCVRPPMESLAISFDYLKNLTV